jgi:homoserine kinase type II
MARMHLAAADFQLRRTNALGVAGWRPLFERFRARADEITPGLAAIIEQELVHQETHWPDDLPQGVIHADLFPDNVFFLGDALSGVIDFYFACNDALIYDVAVALNAWCFETDHSFNITKGHALLKGYESVRPISQREREVLPLLARGSALRFLLTARLRLAAHAQGRPCETARSHRVSAPPQIPPHRAHRRRLRLGGCAVSAPSRKS